MGLRTAEEFLNGLRDAREVYYRGERVPMVTEHAELGVAARHAAIDFELAEDAKAAIWPCIARATRNIPHSTKFRATPKI